MLYDKDPANIGFEQKILQNLAKADIQNGRRDERLMCGILPGITVWDAIEEALRRHTPPHTWARSGRSGVRRPRSAAQRPYPVRRPGHRTDQRGGTDRSATLGSDDGRSLQ